MKIKIKLAIALLMLALMSVPAWAVNKTRCEWGSNGSSYAEISKTVDNSSYVAEIMVYNGLDLVDDKIEVCTLILDDIEFQIRVNLIPNVNKDSRDHIKIHPLNNLYYAEPGYLLIPEYEIMKTKVYKQVVG